MEKTCKTNNKTLKKQKTVSIITLGCKVNTYESEVMYKRLCDLGYEVTPKLCYADYYVINTCGVTNTAEQKSRAYVAKINKLNPKAKIYACGCSTALHCDKFTEKPNVKGVFGVYNKLDIVDAIVKDSNGVYIEEPKTKFLEGTLSKTNRTRTVIKIQDGCNQFCSYCIIPYTRGRERSRSLEDIKKELEFHSTTTKEIVLVGINIAGYGKDFKDGTSLIDVIKLFDKYPNMRIRFSSFEMGAVDEPLLKEFKKHPNFCDFFHLSLQSGEDETLKKMNRHYSTKEYKDIVKLIRKYYPFANISTDVIVGFPTETDEQFNKSLKFVESIGFGNVHVFPYSKRDGTVASRYGELNGLIVSDRTKQMIEVTEKSALNFLKKNLGRTEECLIEKKGKDFFTGFTKNYIHIYIDKSANVEPNKIYKVKLVSLFEQGIKGEIINEKL